MPSETPDLNYKADLQIDQNNLDLEWARFPQIFSKWAERAIDAENLRDRVKDRIELKYAELDSKIRSGPDELPEKAIRAKIINNTEYQKLQEEYLTAKYNAKILRLGAKAIKGNEKILDRLTKLYLAKYYCKPFTKESELVTNTGQIDETSAAQASLNASMNAKRFLKR